MTTIINIGMNHETAPIELRECLAPEQGNTAEILHKLKSQPFISEALFLSTCNRVEALIVTDNPEAAGTCLTRLFSELGGLKEDQISSSLYMHKDMSAVKHIFMVASSLDSLVVGEPQILGQIKEAYHDSVSHNAADVILNRLMHRAFHTAKRVRTETGICAAAVSISYAAVELAKKIFHHLDGKQVLLIGAGEMAELAAKQLLSHGVSSMTIANRTFERAAQMARAFNATPVSFSEITTQLYETDIVITSTASSEYIVTLNQVKNCLRKRRNRLLFFIDIAVPRDVQPEVNKLDNVYVYDVDDLKDVVFFNKTQRQQETHKAERIIEEEIIKFEKWLRSLAVVPTIATLKSKAEALLEAELKKSKSGLNGVTSEQMEAVRKLTHSIADKMLSDPILFLKNNSDNPGLPLYLDMTKKLFNLDSE